MSLVADLFPSMDEFLILGDYHMTHMKYSVKEQDLDIWAILQTFYGFGKCSSYFYISNSADRNRLVREHKAKNETN